MKSVRYGMLLAVFALSGGALLTVFDASPARALPFNTDMAAGQNLQAGTMMRPKAPETVPMGSVRTYVRTPEEAIKLQNPVASSRFSIEKGKRLYEVNCKTCHGAYKNDESGTLKFENGTVYDFLKAGALVPPALHNSVGPDGYFFQMIHFGRQIPIEPEMIRMPAYGWKFSIKEHWDIVNYIRSVQEKMSSKGKN